MATQKQVSDEINLIEERFDNLFSYSIEEIIREEDLGTAFSFKEVENDLVKIFELFKRVKEVNLYEVPYNLLKNLNAYLLNAINLFDQAKVFNPVANNASNIRLKIISDIHNSYDTYLTHCLPILTIGVLRTNDLSVERSKMNQLIKELENEKNKTKEEGDKKLKELNDIIENAKSFAVKAGVSKHSSLFEVESNFHEQEAKKWLNYTVIILVVISLVAVGLAFLGLYFKDNVEMVQFTITKIVVLTSLFYGLSITNRNYKAHKHNSITNKHRQNALSTFETFSNAASADDQTKNAVLLETTHSIFSNQQTGYLKSEGDSDSNNRIIEIIKNVTSKGE